MPTLRELITKVGFNVDDRALAIYDKAIGRVYQKADGLYDNLNRVADGISGIGKRLTFTLSLPLAGVGAASVIAAGKVEQFNTSFEIMLGSAEKAKGLMSQLFQFEAKTPFNLEHVMEFAQQLLIAKEPAERITQQLMMLGNVAAGDPNRMKSIVYVLGQVRALGYLQGQDIMQFTNALVPIRDAISKVTGASGKELQRMIEQRKITADIVQKSLEFISSQRGGLMDKQSMTLMGLFSSLTSAIFRLRVALGNLLVDELKLKPLMVWLIGFLNKVVDYIEKMPTGLKRLIVWVGAALFLLGPAMIALGAFLKIFLALRAAMVAMKFAGLLMPLAQLIPLLWKGAAAMAAMAWQATLIALGLAALFLIAEDIWGYFQGKDSVIIPGLKKMLDWYMSYSDTVWRLWKDGFDSIVDYFKQVWTDAFRWYENTGWFKFFEKMGGWLSKGVNAITNPSEPPEWLKNQPGVLAAAGAAPQYNVTVGSVTVPVAPGTPQEQRDSLQRDAESIIKIGIIDQLKKSVVADIQSGTRR